MIDAESIIRKIKNRKFAETNKNYNQERKQDIENMSSDLQADLQEMRRVVMQLKSIAPINDEFNITSHRKVSGRFIVFGKKLIRKFLRWYVHPIAEKQTIYNHANIDTMYYITECIEKLETKVREFNNKAAGHLEELEVNQRQQIEDCKQLVSLVDNVKQVLHKELSEQISSELRNTLYNELKASLHHELRNSLYEDLLRNLHIDLYDSLKEKLQNEIQEELRSSLYENLHTHLYQELYKNIQDSLYKEIIENRINSTDDLLVKARGYGELIKRFNLEKDMRNLEEIYRKMMHSEKQKARVAIVCKHYRKEGISEAIKKEAYTLYSALKANKDYEAYFISIEEEGETHTDEEDIHIIYVNRKDIQDTLNGLHVKLVHIFESNPHIIFDQKMGLSNYNVVFSGTGQAQVVGLDEYAADELAHLVDNNGLHMLVESNKAKEELIKLGIKEVKKVMPIIEEPHIIHKEREGFTVGFASSPMLEEQFADRGMGLLEEVITSNSDIFFRIAWRNLELKVPAPILESNNVEIQYGTIDMNEFYSEIDAIIIPYMSSENNHACSLSAVEAISVNLPVICTNVSGIAEVVEEIDSQCICKCNVQSMNQVLEYVKTHYDEIVECYKRYSLHNKTELLSQYTEVYDSVISEKVKTLTEWNSKLVENNRYLVRGNDNIKKYYESQSIVSNYESARFAEYPMNVVNELEQIAVDEILKIEKGKVKQDTQILDISTGTGRILEKLVDKGQCTVIDNSSEMLKVIIDKFGETSKLNLVKGDFLEVKVNGTFDIITSFRYIRHFEHKERNIILNKIKTLLNENGLLIFDVPNLKTEVALRDSIGWEHFNIYDVFWTKETLESELKAYGLEIVHMVPIDGYYFEKLPNKYRQEPMSWVVAVRKTKGE